MFYLASLVCLLKNPPRMCELQDRIGAMLISPSFLLLVAGTGGKAEPRWWLRESAPRCLLWPRVQLPPLIFLLHFGFGEFLLHIDKTTFNKYHQIASYTDIQSKIAFCEVNIMRTCFIHVCAYTHIGNATRGKTWKDLKGVYSSCLCTLLCATFKIQNYPPPLRLTPLQTMETP